MPTIQKVIAFFSIFLLLSCSVPLAVYTPIKTEKVQFNPQVQSSLTLVPPHFKVIEIDGKLYVIMDMDNYSILSKDMEQIQAIISNQTEIISKYKKYYTNSKTPK